MLNLSRYFIPVMAAIAIPALAQGSLVSEGVDAHVADYVGAPTGVGKTVGVIADPIGLAKLRYLQDVLSELPAVELLPSADCSGLTPDPSVCGAITATNPDDTGLDALQILHDLAPNAGLKFVSPATMDSAGLIAAIAELEGSLGGVDIILDLVSIPNEAVFYEDDLALAVGASADRVLYVVAAGDEGSLEDAFGYVSASTYEAGFNPIALPTAVVDAMPAGYEYIERIHQFTGAADGRLQIATDLESLCLYWADEPNGSYNDYDVFILDATNNIVMDQNTPPAPAISDDFQIFGENQMATECLTDPDVLKAGYQVVIGTDAIASEDRFFHLRGVPVGAQPQVVRTADPSARVSYVPEKVFEITTGGAVFGRAALNNVVAVGSAPVQNSPTGILAFKVGDPISNYSSAGPRHIFYDFDSGYAVTAAGDGDLNSTSGADVRVKPDLLGADDVMVYRVNAAADGATQSRVVSSVIGAAHVAGISAQSLEGQATVPSEVRAALRNTNNTVAVGLIGAAGYDDSAGYGTPVAGDVTTQVALPLTPYDLVVTANRGSATVTFSSSLDDPGSFKYFLTCDQTGTVTTPGIVNGQEVQSGFKFAVAPGSTVSCSLVAETAAQVAGDTVAGNTGSNTVGELQAPTLDRVTPEPFGFTVVYGIDPDAADGTYTNTIVCLNPQQVEIIPADTLVPASPATFDDDLEPDVELSCTLDIAASINGQPQASGSMTFDPFLVTPENMSGLPIWLLYEATKATQPATP